MGGSLIDKTKLAHNRQARAEHRTRILEAARHCFQYQPLASVSLERIGQRAGVREGLAAMLFADLGELFLTVLKSESDDWYRALADELGATDQRLTSAALARLLAGSLRGRESLARMLAILPVMLEQVVESPAALIFLRSHHDWVERVGAAIEAHHPRLASGDGGRLLGCLQAMAAGLEPALRPLGVMGLGLGAVADGRQLDFHGELELMLRRLLDGWAGVGGA